VLLGLRTAPKEDSGVSAAELSYGGALALPAEFLSTAEPPAADFLQKLQQVELPPTRPLSYTEAALQASHVYVRRGGTLPPMSPLYVGPYEVLERSDKCFQLAVSGREETVSVDCLKPHLGTGPFTAALHAERGRPPTSSPVVFQPQHPQAAVTMGVLSRSIVIFNVRVCGQ